MRMAVIERDGVLHYALKALGGKVRRGGRRWFVFCDSSARTREEFRDDDIQEDLPTCVRCLGEEALRGKDLEPIDGD